MMTEKNALPRPDSGLSRRALLAGVGLFATTALLPRSAFAIFGAWSLTTDALAVLDGREPISQGVVIDVPGLSENGAVVPLGISIDRPMTEGEFVTALHVFAPANPYAHIATYRYPSAQTPPRIETRIRLNESQPVIVLAELNTGTVLVGEKDVRVTVSGCLTQSDTYAAESLFQTRVRVEPGQPVSVLTLINHPQETGLRTDAQGAVIPKRLIEQLEARYNGEVVFTAELHRSVSSNPYLRFFFQPEGAGELDLVWTEDTGETAEFSTQVSL